MRLAARKLGLVVWLAIANCLPLDASDHTRHETIPFFGPWATPRIPNSGCSSLLRQQAEEVQDAYYSDRDEQLDLLEKRLKQLHRELERWVALLQPSKEDGKIKPFVWGQFDVRQNVLKKSMKDINVIIQRIRDLPDSPMEDRVTSHDLINILGIAGCAVFRLQTQLTKTYEKFDPAALRLVEMNPFERSQMEREVKIVAQVIAPAIIHTSHYDLSTPRAVLKMVSVAEVCESITALFPNWVTCPIPKDARETKIKIDLQGLIRSLANLHKNAGDAFLSRRKNDGVEHFRAFDPSVVINIWTPENPLQAGIHLSLDGKSGERTLVLGDHAPGTSYLSIRFKDNAGGIPPDLLQKIFVKGASGHEDASRGLGLFSVAREVENHRGAIYISSDMEKAPQVSTSSETATSSLGLPGTTVDLLFPFPPPPIRGELVFPLPEPTETEAAKQNATARSIVFIDDANDAHLMASVFIKASLAGKASPDFRYTLVPFRSRRDAIAAILAGRIDPPSLILSDEFTEETDVSMEALAEAVKSVGEKIPLGRCSANRATEENRPAGYDYEISKPFDLADFQKIFQQVGITPKIDER